MVVGGERWRVREVLGCPSVQVRRPGGLWEIAWAADSWPQLSMAIKEAGFRAVYPEAVEPLCKAIQERMDAEKSCGCRGPGHCCEAT